MGVQIGRVIANMQTMHHAYAVGSSNYQRGTSAQDGAEAGRIQELHLGTT